MKILQYYNSVIEAEIIKGRLESEGIQAFVQNSNLPYLTPFSSISPYIEVADEDYDRALAILSETDPFTLQE